MCILVAYIANFLRNQLFSKKLNKPKNVDGIKYHKESQVWR